MLQLLETYNFPMFFLKENVHLFIVREIRCFLSTSLYGKSKYVSPRNSKSKYHFLFIVFLKFFGVRFSCVDCRIDACSLSWVEIFKIQDFQKYPSDNLLNALRSTCAMEYILMLIVLQFLIHTRCILVARLISNKTEGITLIYRKKYLNLLLQSQLQGFVMSSLSSMSNNALSLFLN